MLLWIMFCHSHFVYLCLIHYCYLVATENGTEDMIDGGFIAKFILKTTIFLLLNYLSGK